MALALPQPEPNSPQATDPTPAALRRGDGRSSAQEAARRGCAVVGAVLSRAPVLKSRLQYVCISSVGVALC
jgi:hypothetical protein